MRQTCWSIWRIIEKKRVTRNIIFRKVLELDQNLLGGVRSDKHMEKSKKWFYNGLELLDKLYIRKIASVGQKLLPN